MNGCEKYIDLISELIDGEISDADRSELEIHLEFCPECRKAAEALAAISANFPKEEEVPANFTEGTMAKIKAEGAKPVGIKKFISGYGKYTGLAAALVVILLGAQVFSSGERDTAAPMAPMTMMADSAANTETVTGGTAFDGEVYSKESAAEEELFNTSDADDIARAPAAGADVPEAAPMDSPAEECAPDEAPVPEPTAAPQFSVTVAVTDIDELYKRRGYSERFYSVSHMEAPISDEVSELLSEVSTEIYSSQYETHYRVPMDALNTLDPEIFTEIVFDDLTAQYGLLIVLHEVE